MPLPSNLNLAAAPSPCINVCVMDAASGWCTGCFRSMDEIVAWGSSSVSTRLAVLNRLAQREAIYMNTPP